jgi:hypothetical protein
VGYCQATKIKNKQINSLSLESGVPVEHRLMKSASIKRLQNFHKITDKYKKLVAASHT